MITNNTCSWIHIPGICSQMRNWTERSCVALKSPVCCISKF
uniref:Alternative protein PCDHB9 n=1 Tax=Homo sapiens TaxID=9606 RepID=L8E8J0_HUMAN|nr:alternative protein PCDHB9 [Homo sapiens]